MANKILGYILLVFFLLSHSFYPGYSQGNTSHNVRVMFYNAENLFDTYNDSLTDDNDFLPEGVMRWNLTRYNKKINSIYKTIMAAGEWEPPAIVALCEIENRKVLEDIIYGTFLSKFNYSIIHEESPDRRGIDVCLIYRKKVANILSYKYWIPDRAGNESFNSRSVLYIKSVINSDTIHIIVNHWPSRRGGVLAGEDNRLGISSMVREKVDSLFRYLRNGTKILILGDFNCTPDDQIIRSFSFSEDAGESLINLSDSIYARSIGTYRYQGRWEMIDQVIVSQELLVSDKGLYTRPDLLKVFKSDFLLKKDPKYPGLSPYSTYRGYKYQGGYSDHLPVILDLIVR